MIKINICLEFTPEFFPNNVFHTCYYSINKWFHSPINNWQTIKEICNTGCILATLTSFCINKHWFQLPFFFPFIGCSLHKSMYVEESSVQHLHLLSTLTVLTVTASKRTNKIPIHDQGPFHSPHNSAINSPDLSSSLPIDDTATSSSFYPFKCFFFDLFTDFSFLPPPRGHLSTFASAFSPLSLHPFLQ